MYKLGASIKGVPVSAKSFVAVVFGLFASLFLSSCGGSGTKPPISVSVHASATQVDGTDSVSLQAVVANDTRGLGVTWSVTGGGALSNTTQIGTTYTAPAVPATPLTVTVTATSVSDPTGKCSSDVDSSSCAFNHDYVPATGNCGVALLADAERERWNCAVHVESDQRHRTIQHEFFRFWAHFRLAV